MLCVTLSHAVCAAVCDAACAAVCDAVCDPTFNAVCAAACESKILKNFKILPVRVCHKESCHSCYRSHFC
jgi:hypothetical protein